MKTRIETRGHDLLIKFRAGRELKFIWLSEKVFTPQIHILRETSRKYETAPTGESFCITPD